MRRALFLRERFRYDEKKGKIMVCETFSPRPGVTLAFHRTSARDRTLPGVIFLGGFMSDMTGTKAVFLESFCAKRGQGFVRFDYEGHGVSSGKFEEGTIGLWLQDALDAFDTLTEGPQIVVGSSMGGWLALLLALRRPKRVAGLIGLAPAPDFSDDVYHHELTQQQRDEIDEKGVTYLPNLYGAPYPLTRQLFDEARQHYLLRRDIAIHCPVRLIHGKLDPDVPWKKSLQIKEKLLSGNVKIHWVEDGDHRLSRDQDLSLLGKTVAELG